MTKEMQELIDRELNAALESGDAKLVDRALINSQRALADCQLKTKTDEANGVVSNVTVNVTAGR